MVYKYLGFQKITGPVTMASLGWRSIPDELPNIDAVYKISRNRIYFISGRQYYIFNDEMKYFVNADGQLLRSMVPDLPYDCGQ